MYHGKVKVSEGNGHGKSRLDEIEEIIKRQELANEAAHERFEAEDKRLLTAQILMNDAMAKMNDSMARMNDAIVRMSDAAAKTEAVVAKTSEAVAKTNESMGKAEAAIERLTLAMEETTGKLNALIDTVDGIIRRKNGGAETR